jgi:hypothetical protein
MQMATSRQRVRQTRHMALPQRWQAPTEALRA